MLGRKRIRYLPYPLIPLEASQDSLINLILLFLLHVLHLLVEVVVDQLVPDILVLLDETSD
jgi:hypothetical protein